MWGYWRSVPAAAEIQLVRSRDQQAALKRELALAAAGLEQAERRLERETARRNDQDMARFDAQQQTILELESQLRTVSRVGGSVMPCRARRYCVDERKHNEKLHWYCSRYPLPWLPL